MNLLHTYDQFPAQYESLSHGPVTIVGFFDDAVFVGVSLDEWGAFPVFYNSRGEVLAGRYKFEVVKSSGYNLLTPQMRVERQFDALDSNLREALKAIKALNPEKKINCIKIIRQLTGWGLVESKVLFEEVL